MFSDITLLFVSLVVFSLVFLFDPTYFPLLIPDPFDVFLVAREPCFSVEDGFHKTGTHTVPTGTAWYNPDVAGKCPREAYSKSAHGVKCPKGYRVLPPLFNF